MKKHTLKTDPEVFDAVAAGLKTFEIRKDDRGFQVGDLLYLERTRFTGAEMRDGKPLEYTGQKAVVEVSHILRGPLYGLQEDWVILSFKATSLTVNVLDFRSPEPIKQPSRWERAASPRTWGELKAAIADLPDAQPVTWINQPVQDLYRIQGTQIHGFQ